MKKTILITLAIMVLALPVVAQMESAQQAVQPLAWNYTFCDTANATDWKLIDIGATAYVELLSFYTTKDCSLRYVAKSTAEISAPTTYYRLDATSELVISNPGGIDSLIVYNEGTEAEYRIFGQRR